MELELNKEQKRSLTTIKKKIIDTFTGEMQAQIDLIVAIAEVFKAEVWQGISVRQLTAQLANLSIGKEQHKAGQKTVSKSTVHRYMRVATMLSEANLDSLESVTELFEMNFTVTKLVDIDKGNAGITDFLDLVETVKGETSEKARKAEIVGFVDDNKKESKTSPKEPANGSDVGETNQSDEELNRISIDKFLTRIFTDIASGEVAEEIKHGSIDLMQAWNKAVESVASDVDNFLVVFANK